MKILFKKNKTAQIVREPFFLNSNLTFGQIATLNCSLEVTSPTYNRIFLSGGYPVLSDADTNVYYQLYQISPSITGSYSFAAVYPGDAVMTICRLKLYGFVFFLSTNRKLSISKSIIWQNDFCSSLGFLWYIYACNRFFCLRNDNGRPSG